MRFETLESVKQMGGQVVRIFPLSVRNPDEDPIVPKHILGIGKFDEKICIRSISCCRLPMK